MKKTKNVKKTVAKKKALPRVTSKKPFQPKQKGTDGKTYDTM